MTINPEPILAFAIPFALIAAGIGILTKIAGPKWILGLFESEGEPSLRRLLAAVVVVFTLFMLAANRLTISKLDALLLFAGTLLGLGTALKVGTRFAARPPTPTTQIKANNAPVTTDSTTITTATNEPASPQARA